MRILTEDVIDRQAGLDHFEDHIDGDSRTSQRRQPIHDLRVRRHLALDGISDHIKILPMSAPASKLNERALGTRSPRLSGAAPRVPAAGSAIPPAALGLLDPDIVVEVVS